MNAAPFDGDSNNDMIQRKKTEHNHNRTQKKNHYINNSDQNDSDQNNIHIRNDNNNINTEKVNSVLQSIHNSVEKEHGDLGDYYGNPPPLPTSIGSGRASIKENMQNNVQTPWTSTDPENKQPYPAPSSIDGNDDLQNLHRNYGDDNSAIEYYKKYIPQFSSSMLQPSGKQPYYKTQTSILSPSFPVATDTNQVLIEKLNYMIHLLEESQDERTNHVMEEVILYSFLGIFIIFIVDSFHRHAKYTR